jgi:hypothetical protein
MVRRVRVIHWKPEEVEARSETLRAAGLRVDDRVVTPATLRELKRDPPDAIVIDLSRLPAQGRDLGLLLREAKATRHVPLVFVEGGEDKVARARELLPDASFSRWRAVRGALKRAIARPPADPSVPSSRMAGYAGTPLPKKLGIQAGMKVSLVDAPAGFDTTLGDLPEGVTLRRGGRGRSDLTIWFVRSRREIQRRVTALGAAAGRGGLWIVWPKRASGVRSDLSQAEVRRLGLASGLVDYKVCAVDATWAGLRFTRRRQRR